MKESGSVGARRQIQSSERRVLKNTHLLGAGWVRRIPVQFGVENLSDELDIQMCGMGSDKGFVRMSSARGWRSIELCVLQEMDTRVFWLFSLPPIAPSSTAAMPLSNSSVCCRLDLNVRYSQRPLPYSLNMSLNP